MWDYIYILKSSIALLCHHFKSSVDQILTDFLTGTVLGTGDTVMGNVHFSSSMLVDRQEVNKYIL